HRDGEEKPAKCRARDEVRKPGKRWALQEPAHCASHVTRQPTHYWNAGITEKKQGRDDHHEQQVLNHMICEEESVECINGRGERDVKSSKTGQETCSATLGEL